MGINATIELVEDILPHPNADKLEIVKVLGYECLAPIGLHHIGDKVVYIRPDNILPDLPWAVPYKEYAPKRIKPIRLRGVWSEGILLGMREYEEHLLSGNIQISVDKEELRAIGYECSELLGVVHWEPPLPQDNDSKGNMPYEIFKTDEVRYEERKNKLPYEELVDVSLKIDGMSCTIFYHIGDDRSGICSRSLEKKTEGVDSHFARMFNKYIEPLKAYCIKNNVSLALRGELYGQGIQGSSNNPHSKLPAGFMLYNIFYIDERRYAYKGDPFYYLTIADELGIPTVPTIEADVPLTMEMIDKYSHGIDKLNDNYFEGVVIKHANGSFKVINKTYDSKK